MITVGFFVGNIKIKWWYFSVPPLDFICIY